MAVAFLRKQQSVCFLDVDDDITIVCSDSCAKMGRGAAISHDSRSVKQQDLSLNDNGNEFESCIANNKTKS